MWKQTSTENYHCPLDWWTVERNKDQVTATETTDSAAAGYAQTEGGTVTSERDDSPEDNSEGGSNSHEKPAEESEYFAPDPYSEAAEADETQFFALRR